MPEKKKKNHSSTEGVKKTTFVRPDIQEVVKTWPRG